MSKRRLIDTNLIIRHLVQDSEQHAKTAQKVFDSCDRGEVSLVLLSAVLAECVFVLESFYQHRRSDISESLSKLITSPGIEIDQLATHLDALVRYCRTSIHFVDCLIAANAAAGNLAVASFDKDFRKFPDVEVQLD